MPIAKNYSRASIVLNFIGANPLHSRRRHPAGRLVPVRLRRMSRMIRPSRPRSRRRMVVRRLSRSSAALGRSGCRFPQSFGCHAEKQTVLVVTNLVFHVMLTRTASCGCFDSARDRALPRHDDVAGRAHSGTRSIRPDRICNGHMSPTRDRRVLHYDRNSL
jgi:hypothetical protein